RRRVPASAIGPRRGRPEGARPVAALGVAGAARTGIVRGAAVAPPPGRDGGGGDPRLRADPAAGSSAPPARPEAQPGLRPDRGPVALDNLAGGPHRRLAGGGRAGSRPVDPGGGGGRGPLRARGLRRREPRRSVPGPGPGTRAL